MDGQVRYKRRFKALCLMFASFERNADFPMKPEFRFQLVESRKMSYDNARES